MTILFEDAGYFITASAKKGYEVYRNGATAATRVAMIGYEGQRGWDRAIEEIQRRKLATR